MSEIFHDLFPASGLSFSGELPLFASDDIKGTSSLPFKKNNYFFA